MRRSLRVSRLVAAAAAGHLSQSNAGILPQLEPRTFQKRCASRKRSKTTPVQGCPKSSGSSFPANEVTTSEKQEASELAKQREAPDITKAAQAEKVVEVQVPVPAAAATIASEVATAAPEPLLSFGPLLPGKLIKRYKRFLADVELEDGSLITVHCPNTGPMTGLLDTPMAPVKLSTASNQKRKYAHTLEMIQTSGEWVGIHSAQANKAVLSAMQQGLIPELGEFQAIKAEVKYGTQKSRVDFVLERAGGSLVYVEVKSVTLAGELLEDGTLAFGRGNLALFPDTVSVRAQRHLEELMGMVDQRHEAAVIFLVQRGDCISFSPCDKLDPRYGQLLRKAVDHGVKVLPLKTTLLPDPGGGLRFDGPLPLVFLSND